MAFNPKPEYSVENDKISIRDFFDYKDEYVTRPPYQRKSVWPKKKKQSLLDSLFRRYYVPRLVIREVRLSETNTIREVIDGQQRITAVQEFFNNDYPLPASLGDISDLLPGKHYKDLDSDIRKFIDKSLKYEADVIKSIDQPRNVSHQNTATEIFWRLQQGETLNYMEVAHAQLSSLTRNFIVKYADDQSFDNEGYQAIEGNPKREPFFTLLDVNNMRMKHLQYMARFLMIEKSDGYTDLSDRKIEQFINEAKKDNGIGDESFENEAEAKNTLITIRVFFKIFQNDPMLDDNSVIKELSVEYFVISIYMLIRHLNKYYIIDENAQTIIRNFVYYFHNRWKTFSESEDNDLLTFSNRRQQGERDLEVRDMILRQIFFKYLIDEKRELIAKDQKRAFSEYERIIIYRRDKGLCQECLREGHGEDNSKISWSNYHADHVIPHSKGGQTILDNAEALCAKHNLSKGAL